MLTWMSETKESRTVANGNPAEHAAGARSAGGWSAGGWHAGDRHAGARHAGDRHAGGRSIRQASGNDCRLPVDLVSGRVGTGGRERDDLDRHTRHGGVQHPAVTDIHAHVGDRGIEGDQVTDLQLVQRHLG